MGTVTLKGHDLISTNRRGAHTSTISVCLGKTLVTHNDLGYSPPTSVPPGYYYYCKLHPLLCPRVLWPVPVVGLVLVISCSDPLSGRDPLCCPHHSVGNYCQQDHPIPVFITILKFYSILPFPSPFSLSLLPHSPLPSPFSLSLPPHSPSPLPFSL